MLNQHNYSDPLIGDSSYRLYGLYGGCDSIADGENCTFTIKRTAAITERVNLSERRNTPTSESEPTFDFGSDDGTGSAPGSATPTTPSSTCASILETFENTQCCNPTDFVQNIQCANIKQKFKNNDCSHICAAHGERRKRKKRVFRWTYPPKQEV